ncbi:MAG: ACT domain-containing protein [Oscillospiraceae bacterium]
MQAVITVVGTDKVGILAKISTICAQADVNIEEVTQTILRGTFAMIMLATLPDGGIAFGDLAQLLREGGQELGVEVTITRQDTFDAMHRI